MYTYLLYTFMQLCMYMYISIYQETCVYIDMQTFVHSTHKCMHTSRNTGKIGASNSRQGGKLPGAAGPLSLYQTGDAE